MSWLFGADDEGGNQQQTATEAVERMVQRLQTSPLPDEKRGAILGLRAMAKTAKVDVGTRAMEPVLAALRDDHSDHEMTRAGLEMLYIVMSVSNKAGNGRPAPEDMGVMFTEIFIKDTSHAELLLTILEEEDHQVKYYTIKLLTLCMENCPGKLQDFFLTSPQGIALIMDHLNAGIDDVIRNEVLLLAIEITKKNVQLQKIVVFAEAFDKIFAIIAEEQGCEGGIVVEDCLNFAANLLRNNDSNQSYFRETGCVAKLGPLIGVGTEEGALWGPQKLKNMSKMFELLQLLVAPSNSAKKIADCQAAMRKSGVLDALCKMCLSGRMPDAVFLPVLMTTADVIRGSHESQAVMAELANGEALVIMIQIAYDAKRPFVERCAALYCFQCTLYKNPDMQLRIAATFLPSPAGSSPRTGPSAGQVLCQGLLTGDPLNTWFSALAFSHVLVGNRDAKEKTLRVAIQQQGAAQPMSLLSVCVTNLKKLQPGTDGDERKRAALAILLITWLSDCPYAISVFLEIQDVIGHLVSQLNESAGISPIGQGLIGVLLSTCVAYNDNSNDRFSKQAILDTITKGVGQETFLGVLDKFINSDVFSLSVKSPKFVESAPEKCWFDLELAQLFRRLAVMMQAGGSDGVPDPALTGGRTASAPSGSTSVEHHEQTIAMYKDLIKSQDVEMAGLKSQIAAAQPGQPLATASPADDAELAQLRQATEAYQAERDAAVSTAGGLQAQLAHSVSTANTLQQQVQALTAQQAAAAQAGAGPSQADELAQQQLQSALADVGELHNQLYKKDDDIQAFQLQLAEASASGADAAAELAAARQQAQAAGEAAQAAEAVQLATAASLEQATAQLQALQQSADAAMAELAAAKETAAENEATLAEHEDLLICLAEQEKKMGEYKGKLRALGQEVSDEDDDDDDDDEESEDEEA